MGCMKALVKGIERAIRDGVRASALSIPNETVNFKIEQSFEINHPHWQRLSSSLLLHHPSPWPSPHQILIGPRDFDS